MELSGMIRSRNHQNVQRGNQRVGKHLALLLLLFVTVGLPPSAVPQKDVPPPPKPAESGPTLAATLGFVADKLGSADRLNFAGSMHDNINGDEWITQWTEQFTNVRADVPGCRINLHWSKSRDGQPVVDADIPVSFKDAEEVQLMPMANRIDEANAKAGHPQWRAKDVNPPMYVIVVKRKSGDSYLDLADEDLAGRLCKAMQHAIEICGGGSKELF
jgi:hypothetical protein